VQFMYTSVLLVQQRQILLGHGDQIMVALVGNTKQQANRMRYNIVTARTYAVYVSMVNLEELLWLLAGDWKVTE